MLEARTMPEQAVVEGATGHRLPQVLENPLAGKILGGELVSRSGDLEIVDAYFGGNLGIGRPQQKDKGWSGQEETIVRSLRPSETFKAETAFMITVPSGKKVNVTLRNEAGKLSDMAGDDINFIIVPKGLQVYGKIGDMEFVTSDGENIQFGGWLGWGEGQKNIVVMHQGQRHRIDDEHPSIDLGDTGIHAHRWH